MTSDKAPAQIVWFRSDLRLTDHAPLLAACESGKPLIACYVFDESSPWRLGGASRWWLHHSLAALAIELEALGGRLILRRGSARQVLNDLATETGATHVHCSTSPEPQEAALEESLRADLEARAIELTCHPGALLFSPDAIYTKKGNPFQVFTPFWNALLALPDPGAPLPAPEQAEFYKGEIHSESLQDFELLPRAPDWAIEFSESWTPGEPGAHSNLENFLDSFITGYRNRRDLPHANATSNLSAHLRFGEISPRQVWHAVREHMAQSPPARPGGEAFLRQLGWREFSYYLLHHWPTLPSEPFRSEYADFPWREDPLALECWQRGRTGYPIVDAGMRQLWRTGWMHNRIRMVAASFLVKHMLIPWQDGANWFWGTLVDADLANNSAGWQWVAGCGADAAPYFRIFNPMLQGKKFDPDGGYIRRWIPELSKLPARYIHEPWTAPADVLEAAGIELGQDYPKPIVDHHAARARALAAYSELRARTKFKRPPPRQDLTPRLHG
jgi:deoxyribodipyrimidine photo-lyase